jgi:hypothetical protein
LAIIKAVNGCPTSSIKLMSPAGIAVNSQSSKSKIRINLSYI